MLCGNSLELRNCLVMTENLCGRSYERNQMGELGPKFLYAGMVDEKEKVCLGLLGKTGSIEMKFDCLRRHIQCLALD